jgi:hypothetical protein
VVILLLVFFLAPAKTYSCECGIFGDGSPNSMKHYAKAVFIGEVLEVREATTAEREEYPISTLFECELNATGRE